MPKEKKERRILVFTGAAALVAVGLNLLLSAINTRWKISKKKGLPGSSVLVDLSASEISKLADCIIAKSKETYDRVASIPLEKVCYDNVVSPLTDLDAQQFPLIQSCVFQWMVSASVEVRNASLEAEKRLDAHFLLSRKREDVYRVIKALLDKGGRIKPAAKRYIQNMVKEMERHGTRLSPSKRIEMERIKSQLDELSLRYIENLSSGPKYQLLSEQELAGMPHEFIKDLENIDGKRKILLTNYHVTPILEHCKVGSTRKLIATAYGQRGGKENLHILKKMVQLRIKFAQLLGYPNYADFATELRMARSSAKVFQFLEEVSSNLTELAERELNLLKDLKRKEEGDVPFGMQDLPYYMKRAEEEHLAFDFDFGEVKRYFPVNIVLSGILKIYQDLFGLRFEQITDAEVWHDTVQLFSVHDCSASELLGYFYLDIFSREGKYAHTCVVPLQNGCSTSDGTRLVAVALLLSQCPNEKDGNTALLRFTEVVTLFHEFSHVVHHICNFATFSKFSGLRSDGDFVEVPGLLLENWCYESISLKMLSGFHQDITKSITSEMCKSLKIRRDMFSGLKIKQEILLCLLDQTVHSREDVDIIELVNDMHPKVMMGIPLLEDTNPASCFPRLAVGYESVCYSYIWSQVLAANIFASKFEDDLLNHHAGLQFRKKVLAPGSTKDTLEIISEYLGWEPSIKPFIESKSRSSV
ncbi:putative thimet oligopeptidase [Carex littledalei]|uniref:Putative thimet oligopeptidase n=1 Tax=Carex littledalei TaxID=544730 RepID=A0A833QX54_9POAL|nr:putative thimet oligopeptidase [Carex littledalei]